MPRGVYNRNKARESDEPETPAEGANHEEEPATEEDPAEFSLSIEVPTIRLDDVIGAIAGDEIKTAVLEMMTNQTKADLLQAILQRRMNEALAPSRAELPQLAIAS